MHPVQHQLFELFSRRGVRKFVSLRELGRQIGEKDPQPQGIKHHLLQLEKQNLIRVNWEDNSVEIRGEDEKENSFTLIHVPVLGSANCGAACIFAEERPEGMLLVSSNLVPKKQSLFAVRAVGDSMNRAQVLGSQAIDDGDFVIVDTEDRDAKNGDYVLSIIDGCANIKRFYRDPSHHQIVLNSESTIDYPPIVLHESDASEMLVNGKVVSIIKKPQIN